MKHARVDLPGSRYSTKELVEGESHPQLPSNSTTVLTEPRHPSCRNMLFSKVAVPTLAVLGFATNVMALKGTIPAISVPKIPVGSVPAVPAVPANLPVKRSDLVLSTVQGVVANVAPLMDNLSTIP